MPSLSRLVVRFGLLFACLLPASAQAPTLSVQLLNPGVRLSWTNLPPAYQLESISSLAEAAVWQPVDTVPVVQDGQNVVVLPPDIQNRYFRLNVPRVATIRDSSPVNGELGVGVMRETILRFTQPLATNTLISPDNFYAGYGGRRLLSRVELSSDRRTATLFYLEPMPGGSQITAVFDATGVKDELGREVDADDDGTPGGVAVISFSTFGNTALAGTAVIGHVFAAELMPGNGTTGTVNHPLANVTVTVDGQEQTLRAVTDAQGYFKLDPAPAGRFFVKIDGRTATESNYPDGAYYPFVAKPWEAVAGRTNNLAGGTGEIYLPRVMAGTLQPVSAVADTTVTFPPAVLAANPALAGVTVTVPANSLFDNNGVRGGRIGIAPVSPDRLPAPLPPGLSPALVFTIQSDGPQNFDRPAPVRFPNLPDTANGQVIPPGGKSALWSFNHKSGRWEIQGGMTASADGKFLDTDPGVGVLQPGWHLPGPGNNGDCGPVPCTKPDPGPDGPNDPGDPCKKERHLAQSAGVQCAVGVGLTVATTLLKATPVAGCVVSIAQGIASSAVDCNLDPAGCKVTIANNAISSIIGCIPVVGAGLSGLANGAGVVKGCLIDAGGALGAYENCKTANGLSRPPPHRRALPASPGVSSSTIALQLHLLEAAADVYALVFGDVQWSEIEPADVPVGYDLLSAIAAAMQPGTDGAEHITAAEQTVILTLPRPANISAQTVTNLLARLEQITSHTDLDTGFDLTGISQAATALAQFGAQADALGWKTSYDGLFQLLSGLSADESQAAMGNSQPGSAKPLSYRLMNFSSATELYGQLNSLGGFDNLVLVPDTFYELDYVDRDTLQIARTFFQAGPDGGKTSLPHAFLQTSVSADTDGDGLPDDVEAVIGTNPNKADTDGDGINDGAEVQQGTDPLDGLPVTTGIVAAVQTLGEALDVATGNNLALVAEGPAGVSVYDITAIQPVRLAQVDLGKAATAVAVAGTRGLATVGRDGLVVLDLSNPAQPKIERRVGFADALGDSYRVVSAGNLAYVASRYEIYLVDLDTGSVLDKRLNFGGPNIGTIGDVAVAGDYFYFVTAKVKEFPDDPPGMQRLHKVKLDRVIGPDVLSLAIDGNDYPCYADPRLAVGGGYAYISSFDSDPTNGLPGISIIRDDPSGLQFVGKPASLLALGVAANGSGSVLYADRPSVGLNRIGVLDVRNPANADAIVSIFDVPGLTQSISLFNNLAYVAAREGGLLVLNYLPYDALGVPPVITLTGSFLNGQPPQVEQSKPVSVTAVVTDDVQVRNVEFYLDGQKALTVGRYPFDFRFITPALAQQASFRLRAKATDTGGNSTWTPEITVQLKADLTGPTVVSVLPRADSFASPGAISNVTAVLSEPLAPASVFSNTLGLVSAGPDGILGTADDLPVAGTAVLEPPATVLLSLGSPLGVGTYRATLTTNVTDAAGNPLPVPFAWNFTVAAPVIWTNTVGGPWLTAKNWTNSVLPTSADFAFIDITNGDYTITLEGGTISVASFLSRESLALTDGNLTVAHLSVIEGNLDMGNATRDGAGELDVLGTLDWNRGVFDGGGTTVAVEQLLIHGNYSALNNHTIVNLGQADWAQPLNSGLLLGDSGARIRNAIGATWTTHDRSYMVGTSFPDGAAFQNDGVLRILSGLSDTTFQGVKLTNNGVVQVETGALKVNGGGLSPGRFEVSPGARLQVGGNYRFDVTSLIEGDGGLSLSAGSVNLDGTVDIGGDVIVDGALAVLNGPVKRLGTSLQVLPSGRLTVNGTDLTLTNDIVLNNGFLDLSSPGSTIQPASLVMTNSGFLRGSSDVEVMGPFLARGAVLVGPGKLTVHGPSELGNLILCNYSAPDDATQNREFINAGYAKWTFNDIHPGTGSFFRNLAGATFDVQGDFTFSPYSFGNSSFLNDGTFVKSAGTNSLKISRIAVTNSSLVLINSGKIEFFGNLIQTAGELRLAGGNVGGYYKIDLEGGLMTGNGLVDMYQMNNLGGTVSPGLAEAPVGSFHMTSIYTQLPAATLVLDLQGPVPGTGFDQLTVDSEADLDGALQIRVSPDFHPMLGDSFRILTTAKRVGTFATVSGLDLGGGLKLALTYDATGVTLTVVSGP